MVGRRRCCLVVLMDEEDEVIACVRLEGGKVVVYPLSRGEAHRLNVSHIVVRVLGFSREGLLLVQRRSKFKRSNPGKYTDTASGHISPDEATGADGLFRAAERELLEEVGVRGKLSFFTGPIYDGEDNEVNYVFLALLEGAPMFSDEVDGERSGFRTPEELRAMLSAESFVPVAKALWLHFLERYPRKDDVRSLASSFVEGWGRDELAMKLGEELRSLLIQIERARLK
ncbi:MAG: NUDIX domain-containing protein [Candidatus Freyarchaeota archaeon]|nr:NUDIX domain-containing protein [Candidatus Jordarchaeia archaeon]